VGLGIGCGRAAAYDGVEARNICFDGLFLIMFTCFGPFFCINLCCFVYCGACDRPSRRT